jgi:ribulose-bisphosphate carboxylase large chain
VSRLIATYHVRSDARAIAARAQGIAVEQSVEMPPSAIDDRQILDDIVGRVDDIREISPGLFAVRIALARATVGDDAGQLINMLFGNTSLQEDVVLHDAELPDDLVAKFAGPNIGFAGLRERAGAGKRALTCSALKPQGLAPSRLADLAARFARAGIDYIKDDHGLADQAYSPFAARCDAIAEALRGVERDTGQRVRYVPSLTGDLDALRTQIAAAQNAGIDTVMAQPMIMGLSNFAKLVAENHDLAFFAHPTLAGAARISPTLLFGKLFRLFGADALVFPNHGGRFGYSPELCRELARTALGDWHGKKPAVPVPAGGMTIERIGEMLDFYGPEVMLLIGGALLEARERLTEETAAFVAKVKGHRYAQ